MKASFLVSVVVLLVLISQAGIGFLAFRLESQQKAFAEVQKLEQGRLEKLRREAAEAEDALKRLRPLKEVLAAEVAGLTTQIQEAKVQLEGTLGEVRGLKVEEERLGRITSESKEFAAKLASIEADSAAAQERLDARKKEAVVLEAKVTRLLEDLERLTKDAAYVESAELVGKMMNERLQKLHQSLAEQEETAKSSATKTAEAVLALKQAIQDLAELEKQKVSFEERILERRRELATLDGELSQRRKKVVESKDVEGKSESGEE
ncbi:MAG: hypothetical protein KF712_03125 [Akkermansiaceae bacterium]|nr:hypothetical protein [Akkermansiaceae bacterium]